MEGVDIASSDVLLPFKRVNDAAPCAAAPLAEATAA